MTTKTDGGPAFPVADWDHQTFQPRTIEEARRLLSGMTLRDYFAAKFAVAWVAAITASHANESREAIAIEANRLGLLQADHMLAQRENT